MRIALFDYYIEPTNPIGGCHLRMLRALCREHQFTVFAVRFENPCPQRIDFVRVPVPRRPLVLLYVLFHMVAPLCYLIHCLRTRQRYDLVQMVESNLSFGDVSYCQFCHRRFLNEHWKQTRGSGLRSLLRWMDHQTHAWLEPWIYKRVKRIVVPSRGLAQELRSQYAYTEAAIRVVPNPVDLERMATPDEAFDAAGLRAEWDLTAGDLVLVFIALGHFDRKGLPLLLEALAGIAEARVKLCVVGGESDALTPYRQRARKLGIDPRVRFVGMQRDVRPWLWMADAFVFPSAYETFSLVTFEAAAAGRPVLVSRLSGVEDFLRDGTNGILIGRTTSGVRAGIERFLRLTPAQRRRMGEQAQRDVSGYSLEAFTHRWREVYEEIAPSVRHADVGGVRQA